MRRELAALTLSLATAGCSATTEAGWLDRPWIDSGCNAVGECRLRGDLTVSANGAGVLVLEDGQSLSAVLPRLVVDRRERWDGRRVAVRGRLNGDGVLEVARVSLKVAR